MQSTEILKTYVVFDIFLKGRTIRTVDRMEQKNRDAGRVSRFGVNAQ